MTSFVGCITAFCSIQQSAPNPDLNQKGAFRNDSGKGFYTCFIEMERVALNQFSGFSFGQHSSP